MLKPKYVLSILFLVFSLCVSAFAGNYNERLNAAPAGDPTVSAATLYAANGDTVYVSISAADFVNIGAITLKINYNQSVLTYLGSANLSPLIPGALVANNGGTISIAWDALAGTSFTSARLVDIKFIYHGGVSPIAFNTALCELASTDGNPLAANYINGSVSPIPARLSLNHQFAAAGDTLLFPVAIQDFKNVGALTLKINYDPSVLTWLGSVNLNPMLSGALVENTNGTISIAWDGVSGFTVQQGTLVELKLIYNGGQTDLSFDTTFCEIADVNGNPVADLYTNGRVEPIPARVSVDTVYAPLNGQVLVPVHIADFLNVGALTLKIQYDPAVLTFVQAVNWNVLAPGGIANAAEGVLTIGWDGLNGITAVNAKLVDLKFNYHGGESPITFLTAQCEIADLNGSVLPAVYKNGRVILSPAPAPVVLSNPVNHLLDVSREMFPDWRATPGADLYHIQVAANPQFSSIVFQDSTLTDTTVFVSGLNVNTLYYWRVRAKNEAGTGVWSDVWDFRTVTGYTVSGTVTYRNTVNTPMFNSTVSLRQGSFTLFSDSTNQNGGYSISPVVAGNYSVRPASSIAWGGVNSTDAFVLRRYLVNLIAFDSLQVKAADVNNSGTVTSIDALQIRRRVVGMDTTFIAGDWAFTVPTVQVINSSITQNLQGLCKGDVNASYVPAFLKPAASVLFLSEGEIRVEAGKEFLLPVYTSSLKAFGALTLAFDYPADMLSVIGIESTMDGLLYFADNGILRIAWDGLEGIQQEAGKPLFSVLFKSVNANNTSRPELKLIAEASEFADIEGKVIEGLSVSVPNIANTIPTEFSLSQNFPNPFNPSTTVAYDLPFESKVKLEIFNTLGEVVEVLADAVQAPGRYSVEWNAKNFTSGVYFYRITAESGTKNFMQVKKLMLLK